MSGSPFSDSDFASPTRRTVMIVLIALVSFVYIFRLVQLQVLEGAEYSQKSEAQAIKRLIIEPLRGNMYDRNGEPVVQNVPSFSVNITMKEFRKESIPLLSNLLQITEEELKQILKKYESYPAYTPVKVLRDVDYRIIAALEENYSSLPGISISSESKRVYYLHGNSSHLFGYTKEISKGELERYGDWYRPGDMVGATGLELAYEQFLRGQKGIEFTAVNAWGQRVAKFNDGRNDFNQIDGADLMLTIDKDLQDYADSLLGGYRGAIIAMDPRNGEVLIFVSKPDYDLRAFSGRVPSKLYQELVQDSSKPLFNRALQSIYPPGSTWKMLMALAALEEGIITPTSTIYCPGAFSYGGRSFACHGSHGHADVVRAIQGSCNVFFYTLGLRLGIDLYGKYGAMFGFGQKTGIDIAGEREGLLPTRAFLDRRYGKNKWTQGFLVSLGIGQGELGVTPVQMTAHTVALANGGTLHQPHMVRSVRNRISGEQNNVDFASVQLPIKSEYFDLIRKGMYAVVNLPGGTAAQARVDSVSVCGKTGTAQNPHGKDHAWFTAFAPMDNPRIAITVMVENSGFGGAVAAPMAQKILNRFFHPSRFKPLPPKPQVKDSSGTSPIATAR